MSSYNHFCYILHTLEGSSIQTYNGYTTNITRRLRQHNQEISGGAKSTRRKNNWKYGAIITSNHESFTKIKALQLEWQIRYPTRKKPRPNIYSGIQGRIKGLYRALEDERFSGIPFVLFTDFECPHLDNVSVQSLRDYLTS
jgi:predicted GIY-YIG superfamily endonuclease